jgi:hypothetical protein
MKLLRGIMGKPRRDRVRNMYINGELKIEEVQNQIKRSGVRWFRHNKHRIPKRLLKINMSRRRPR